MSTRLFFNSADMERTGGGSDRQFPTDAVKCSREEANLIGSVCDDGQHMPVLDFDIPARLVPSTTPGHGHLYIDVPMTWEQYRTVLVALRDAGVIERGYADASILRQASMVRPEWVKKQNPRGDA